MVSGGGGGGRFGIFFSDDNKNILGKIIRARWKRDAKGKKIYVHMNKQREKIECILHH